MWSYIEYKPLTIVAILEILMINNNAFSLKAAFPALTTLYVKTEQWPANQDLLKSMVTALKMSR